MKQPAGILVEHNRNDLPFSPDQVALKGSKAAGSNARTPINQHLKSLGPIASEQSPANLCSPNVSKKNNAGDSCKKVTAGKPLPPLLPPGSTLINAGNDNGSESCNM